MKFQISMLLAMSFIISSCGDDDGDKNSSSFVNVSESELLKPTLDLTDASSLFVVDPSDQSGVGLVQEHNLRASRIGAPKIYQNEIDFSLIGKIGKDGLKLATSEDGSDSLQKEDDNGNLTDAITTTKDDSTDEFREVLPKIRTLAVSPKNEIFVHFEHSFRHKVPSGTVTQGDQRLDGSYCQVFRVKGGNLENLKTTTPSADNLECLDYDHFIDSWNANRLSVFQFDDDGNVYYPGSIPNSNKLVIYRWNRSSGTLTEMINSNICVQDFLVTGSGSIFYTGVSSCDGGNSYNQGFFRYLSSSGSLIEIARNWYNFIYEVTSTATGDESIFFGPDPTSSGTASWDSACLFRFDPAGGDTTADRTSKVITCGNNIWDWIQMTRQKDKDTYGNGFQNGEDATDAYKTEYKSRCESSGQVFAGGGSQISSIGQDSSGQVYVIGNLRKKNAGTLTCSVEVRGPHCKNSDGYPDTSKTTESACTDASGTWIDEGWCQDNAAATSSACFTAAKTWNRNAVHYNGVDTSICTDSGAIAQSNWWSNDNTKSFQSVTSSSAHTMKFRLNHMNCQPPASNTGGDQWTSEYLGLGKVNSSDLTLSLLSGTDEQALDLWLINDVVYYSAFNSTSGKYLLRKWDGTQSITMVENFETYHLNATGDSTKLYYDGLDFSDNTYNFGTLLIADPYTREKTVGLTGALKMVILMP